MLTPEQLEQLPNNLVRLYAQLEEDILASMAGRINAMNLFIPATDWQFQKLAEMQNSYDDILKRLSDASGKTEAELRELMQTATSESLKYDDAIHRGAGKSLPPLNQSAALLATLQAGIKRTNGYFENLCRTTANQGSKQFANVLDRAYMQVVSGAFTKEQAIQMAVKDLASQGIHAAQYKNGRKMSLEAAVRMNIITGVNQTCAQLQLERADEAGCDLVEVSAHAGARPDHELWQGKLYSRSGEHPKYPDFVSSTGYGTVTGLCGANCRHNFYPFYEGISKRAYTEKELEQMKARTVPYNGRMLTEYEASQVQRKIERNMRRWKREKAGMKAAGQSTAEAQAKLSHWRKEMENFTRQTGFKRHYSREEIFAGKALQDAEKVSKMNVTSITRKTELLTMEQTVAKAKKFAQSVAYENATTFQELRTITNSLLGYDGLPIIKSGAEYEKIAEGRTRLYRGIHGNGDKSAQKIVDEFKYGSLWTGNSGGAVFGNGVYFSETESIARSSEYAGSGGAVIEAILSEDTKVVDYIEIATEFEKTGIPKIIGIPEEEYQCIIRDVGQYAAMKGYDAIALNGFQNCDYIVVLNRTKVIVKEE